MDAPRLRLVVDQENGLSAKSWERSFPERSVKGMHWIVSVLEDLLAFSEYHKADDVVLELERAKEAIAELIKRDKAAKRWRKGVSSKADPRRMRLAEPTSDSDDGQDSA